MSLDRMRVNSPEVSQTQRDSSTHRWSQYTLVPLALSSFRVFGMSTPSTIDIKAPMLFHDGSSPPTAVVVFDAFRCSSTLLACFARGLHAAVLSEKGQSAAGTTIGKAEQLAQELKCKLILGGELHGRAVSGGVVGNSPIESCTAILDDRKLLHFQSTNFARSFNKITDYVHQQREGLVEIFVISYANAAITAQLIQSSGYERIIAVCGGFFDCMAIEDMTLGGRFISELGIDDGDLDDDSLAMLACYRALNPTPALVGGGWAGRVLRHIGKAEDIWDVIGTSRLPQHQRRRMSNLILQVRWIHGTPMIQAVASQLLTRV